MKEITQVFLSIIFIGIIALFFGGMIMVNEPSSTRGLLLFLGGAGISILSLIILSVKLDLLDWDGLKNLQKFEQLCEDKQNYNKKFIKALEKVIIRKTITMEEIEAEMEKD